jgi:hypothetical protein
MAKAMKRSGRKRSSTMFERTVVYRGIKIPPISGKPSATALAIRDALWTQSERSRGKAANG